MGNAKAFWNQTMLSYEQSAFGSFAGSYDVKVAMQTISGICAGCQSSSCLNHLSFGTSIGVSTGWIKKGIPGDHSFLRCTLFGTTARKTKIGHEGRCRFQNDAARGFSQLDGKVGCGEKRMKFLDKETKFFFFFFFFFF